MGGGGSGVDDSYVKYGVYMMVLAVLVAISEACFHFCSQMVQTNIRNKISWSSNIGDCPQLVIKCLFFHIFGEYRIYDVHRCNFW